MKISEIDEKIKSCFLCGNLQKPECSHLKEGNCNIMVIGESPAKNGWLVSGKAFYDVNDKLQATGKILEKLLNCCNLSINDIYFTECCKCHIQDRKLLSHCSDNCFKFLIEQLKVLDVNVLLTMGVFATQVVLGRKVLKFSDVVGREEIVLIGNKQFIVIPIYHCSPINPHAYSGNKNIFERLGVLVKNKKTP